MTRVTILGMGRIGLSVAETLDRAGLEVCCWNRSHQPNTKFLVKKAIEDAVAGSDTIIICVTDFAAIGETLGSSKVQSSLQGKTVITFTTGSAQEAQDQLKRAQKSKYEYLSGAILNYPDSVGKEGSCILVSGNEKAFRGRQSLFNFLAKNVIWLGNGIELTSKLNLILLTLDYSFVLGLFHAFSACEGLGIDKAKLIELMPYAVTGKKGAERLNETIDAKSYSKVSASVNDWIQVLNHAKEVFQDSGSHDRYIDGLKALLDMAKAKGLGSKDHSIVYESLKV